MPGFVMELSAIEHLTPRHLLERGGVRGQVINEVRMEASSKHNDFDTVDDGEHSTPSPGGPNAQPAREFTLDLIAFAANPAWMTHGTFDYASLYNQLERIRMAKAPVRLKVADPSGAGLVAGFPGSRPVSGGSRSAEILMNVTVRSVAKVIQPGQANVRYISVEFKQHRRSTMNRRRAVGGALARGLPATIHLQSSDTLAGLSRRYLGSAAYWRDVASANNLKNWGQNDLIVKSKRFKAGDSFLIPAVLVAVKGRGFGNVPL